MLSCSFKFQVVSSTTRSFQGTNCSLGFSKRPCDDSQCPRCDSLLWRVPLAAYLAAPDLCVNFTAFLNKPLFFRAPQHRLCKKSRTASPKPWPVSQINNISHVTGKFTQATSTVTVTGPSAWCESVLITWLIPHALNISLDAEQL